MADSWRHEFRNERAILEQLSPELRQQVVLAVNAELMEHVPFFARIKRQFGADSSASSTEVLVAEVTSRFSNRLFRPDEEILTEGDHSDAL